MSSGEARWYAIRVFNNQIYRIKGEFEKLGIRTYMALKTLSAEPEKRARRVQLAPSLLFLRTDESTLLSFKQNHYDQIMVYRKPDSTDPAPIDEKEMEMFILVTSALDGRDVEVTDHSFDFKPGEKVRVTQGPFKGAEGVIRRIKKDRKLLVAVSGVVVVAVSHIPGQFLERLPEQSV